MSEFDYPIIQIIVSAYFHQDVGDFYDSPDDALEDFRRNRTPEELKAASGEITRILEDPRFREDPEGLLEHVGFGYNTEFEGLSLEEWLLKVDRFLRGESVQAAPKFIRFPDPPTDYQLD